MGRHLLPRLCDSGLSDGDQARDRWVARDALRAALADLLLSSGHSAAGLAGWRRKIRCNGTEKFVAG
jgi:hypothetical protein